MTTYAYHIGPSVAERAFGKLGPVVSVVKQGNGFSLYQGITLPPGLDYAAGWSMGCQALRGWVQQTGGTLPVKGLALLDGVHAPLGVSGAPNASPVYLMPWVRLAERAGRGEIKVYWTASGIETEKAAGTPFDSTKAVLRRVVKEAFSAELPNEGTFVRGDFIARTTKGGDAAEHGKHLEMATDAGRFFAGERPAETRAGGWRAWWPVAVAVGSFAWWKSRRT